MKSNPASIGNAKKDITGRRFGRLVAISRTNEKRHRTYVWLCKCDCGKIAKVPLSDLMCGGVKSCGCLNSEKSSEKIKKMLAISDEKYRFDGTDLRKISSIPEKRSKSGVRGVCPDGGKWKAYLMFRGVRHNLGRFSKLEDAARVRARAEEKYFSPTLEKAKKRKK